MPYGNDKFWHVPGPSRKSMKQLILETPIFVECIRIQSISCDHAVNIAKATVWHLPTKSIKHTLNDPKKKLLPDKHPPTSVTPSRTSRCAKYVNGNPPEQIPTSPLSKKLLLILIINIYGKFLLVSFKYIWQLSPPRIFISWTVGPSSSSNAQ